jgi:glutathione peroxidase
MKRLILFCSLALLSSIAFSQNSESFHSLKFIDIDGKERSMSEFKGKYILVVNVASRCGYTKQYKPLQGLQNDFADKLVVIGFPCNQFMGQEPGTEAEIAEFCEKNYGVTFPLASKIDVKGKEQHPIFRWLTDKSLNGKESNEVSWNFNKFLISPTGEWLGYFSSKVDPMDSSITGLIK